MSETNGYTLYERYAKELSLNPYKKLEEKKTRIPCFASFLNLFKSDETIEIPTWAMTDSQIGEIVHFLGAKEVLGFIGINPSVLHAAWESFMLPNLFSLWCTFLYGDEENIIPDYKNFCELVKGQISGTIEEKAAIIYRISLGEGYDSRHRETVPKIIDVSKKCIQDYVIKMYFYDLFASFLYGLGRANNPEYLLWESCGAGLKESHLKVCLSYSFEDAPKEFDAEDIKELLERQQLLFHILTFAVSMMFGEEYPFNMVPFLFSPRPTIIDVSQAIYITAQIDQGNSRYSFNMEMLYSKYLDDDQVFEAKKITNKGPCIVVIKDEFGYVFGCYSNESLRISERFFGSQSCFLFRLLPNFIICEGTTENRFYISLNISRREVVLGMGKAEDPNDQFALWVNLTTGDGACAETCTTWNNFQRLPNNPIFNCFHVEVWKVMRRKRVEYDSQKALIE